MSKRINKFGIFSACLLVLLGFVVYSVNAGVHFIVRSETGTTPTETKSCWQQGYRLTFCASGTCPSCTDENGVVYYKSPTCDAKYIYDSTTCPAPQTPAGTSCDGKFEKCECDASYKYGPDRQTCDNSPGGGSCMMNGKTYYKTCECSTDYKYTCDAALGQVPVNAADSCDGKYKACKCVTSSVPENQRCTQKTSNGLTCYIDCKTDNKTCESEGMINVDTFWNGRLRLYGKLSAVKVINGNNCVSATASCSEQGYRSDVKCQDNKKSLKCPFDFSMAYCPDRIKSCEELGMLSKVPDYSRCTYIPNSTNRGQYCHKDCSVYCQAFQGEEGKGAYFYASSSSEALANFKSRCTALEIGTSGNVKSRQALLNAGSRPHNWSGTLPVDTNVCYRCVESSDVTRWGKGSAYFIY